MSERGSRYFFFLTFAKTLFKDLIRTVTPTNGIDLEHSRFNDDAVFSEDVFRMSALDGYAGMAWHETFKALGWKAPRFNWAYVFLLLLALLLLLLPVIIYFRRRHRDSQTRQH